MSRAAPDDTAVDALAEAARGLELRGFAVVPDLLDAEARATLAPRVEALFASARPRSRQVLYVDGRVPPDTPHLDRLLHQWLNPHRLPGDEGTADLLDPPRALAARLLDAPPVLFQDLLLVKEPGQSRFPWHQDFPFWPIDKPRAVVCWVPLVASTHRAGGLMFARGSHRIGPLPAVDLHRGRPQDPAAEWPAIEGRFDTVCPTLQPGDALVFSPLVLHGSPPRRMGGRRVAWSSVWLHPDVRWCHARAPAHPICRHVVDGARVAEWRPPQPRP